MGNNATIRLGWDNSGAHAGAAEAVRIAQGVKAKTERVLSRGGGGGMPKGGMGQIAMQAQDIAVQAQSGTNALQIFAQQGSQIASIFGPQGAIVGGIAAIGGALVFAGQKGNEAFAELIGSSAAFNAELGKVVASGSVTQIGEMLEAVAKKQEEVAAKSEALTGSFSELALGVLGIFTGGDTQSEKKLKVAEAQMQLERTRQTLVRETLTQSERDLELALAKARGDDATVAMLERRAALEKEILRVRQTSLPTDVQDKLIDAAKQKARAEEQAADAAARAKEARDRGEARAGMNEARKAVETFGESDAEKLKRLEAERVGLQRAMEAARGDEVAQMNAAKTLAEQDLAILQTKAAIEKAIADDKEKQAKAAEDAMEAFDREAKLQADARADEAERQQSARRGRADMEKELEILRLRLAGQDEAAEAADEEAAVRKQALQIADALNVSFEQALGLAREKAGLEKKLEDKKDKGADGRIKGFSAEKMGGRDEARARAEARRELSEAKRGAAYQRGFGGLNDFYADQKNPNFARPKTPLLDAAFGKRGAISTQKAEAASKGGGGVGEVVAQLTESKILQERMVAAVEQLAVV